MTNDTMWRTHYSYCIRKLRRLLAPAQTWVRVWQKSHCSAKTGRLRRQKREKEHGAVGGGPPRHALSLLSGWGGEHIWRLLPSPETWVRCIFCVEIPRRGRRWPGATQKCETHSTNFLAVYGGE